MDVSPDTLAQPRKWSLQAHPLRTDMRILFLSALIVFIVTVFIGLFNGQRLVILSQDVILTHVHAGTIGWITMNVFALCLWLFSDERVTTGSRNQYLRWSSIVAAIAVPLYVLAFLSGNYIARAVFGIPVWLVMAAFFVWILYRSCKVRLNIPQLAILLSLLTLLMGALLGVLLQFQYATNKSFLPSGAFGAHPATLVTGYLVLIGMALSEWRLLPATSRLSPLALVQIITFFLSGLATGLAQLLNIGPLNGVSLLLVVIGTVIYIVRFAPKALHINFAGNNSERFFIMSGLFILVYVALDIYLTVSIITGAINPENIPQNLLAALDHAMFVGVMTNALFGLLLDVTTERRSFWPWSEHVIIVGMNVGLIGFLVALLSNIRDLERIFTPIMGLSILLAIVVYLIRFTAKQPAAVEVTATPQIQQ